ncbi:MAG TPA: hypothetical protein VGM90_08115 [Kofleriaceae bacterium]
MRLTLAAALLLGAGCFSTPAFEGARDGSVGDGGGSGGRALGVGYDMSTHRLFSTYFDMVFDAAHWMTPKALRWVSAPDDELFEFDTKYREDAIGMSLFDNPQNNALYIVDYNGTVLSTPPDESSFQVLEMGPARAKVQVTWSGRSPCTNDADPLLGNTMTFTVYPDGRLLRTDALNGPDAPGGCQPTINAFNTFAGHKTLVYKRDGATETNMQPNDLPTGSVEPLAMSADGWICLQDSHGSLGYTWRFPDDTSLYKEVELLRQAEGGITFGYVISEGTPLAAGTIPVVTEMALRPGVCTDVGNQLESYQVPPTITGALWEDDDAYHTNAAQVSSLAELPAGTAFVFDSRDDVPQLELQGQLLSEGTDFLAQRRSAGGPPVVWLNKPMHVDDVLKIDPN